MHVGDTIASVDVDTWWQDYGSCYTGRTWQDYRSLLADVIRYAPGPPLVDVGCGFGFFVECARRFGVVAIGLEGAAPALAEAHRRHPQADIRQWAAGTALPLDSDSVGAILANEVLDHFTFEQNISLFAECRRVLQPGGALIINSPSRLNRFDTDTGHVSGYTPSELATVLAGHGLDVVHQKYEVQPLLGSRGPGWLAMRAIARVARVERWNARVDLIAIKRG